LTFLGPWTQTGAESRAGAGQVRTPLRKRNEKKLLVTLIVVLSPMVVYSAESSILKTPKEITQVVKSRGATQVVAELFMEHG